MSCAVSIAVAAATTTLVVSGGQTQIVASQGAPIVLELHQSQLTVEAPTAPALIIEVCKQGPIGPPGLVDPAFIVKPNSTLTYDSNDTLIRVDYADGTFKDLTYNASGLLVTVAGVNLASDTVTKTLAYDGDDLLISVSTVVT